MIAHEDYVNYGVAAEGARISTELFTDLDAPIGRVGAAFHPIPFSPPLEEATLPSVEKIINELREVAGF